MKYVKSFTKRQGPFRRKWAGYFEGLRGGILSTSKYMPHQSEREINRRLGKL